MDFSADGRVKAQLPPRLYLACKPIRALALQRLFYANQGY
jgi:hypothetical protein